MKISLVLLLAVCATVAYATQMNNTFDDGHNLSLFEEFKARFNKFYYNDDDHHKSYQNYKSNREHIIKHQMENPTAKFGHTKFSDMSP